VVLAAEAASERLAQGGKLLPQPALGELGEHVWIVRAGDQRLEHPPAGGTEHPAGDRGELDAGVLEHLVQPLHLADTVVDLRLAVASQIAQLADRARRHEARPHEPVFEQLADPLGIGDIGLAAGNVAQMLGVQKPTLAVLLEQVEDRLPVGAGRLHPDQTHPIARQPIEQPEQPGRGGRETPHLLLAPPPLPRHSHASHNRVPVDIQAGATLDQRLHRSSFACRTLAAWRSLSLKNLGFVLTATVTGA
jgi:hypothetical protein